MKKILLLAVTSFLIISIYVINIDRKALVFAVGDSIAMGKTDIGNSIKSHNVYVKEYLEGEGKLEKYIDTYQKKGLRINDVINDINYNKKIVYEDKNYTIKNLLIKSDLVTISINNDDLYNRISTYHNVEELYNWVDEITVEYENMISLIREYCKEKVIVTGYYYPNSMNDNEEITSLLIYLNNEFLQISQINQIEYIDTFSLLIENQNTIGKYFPTKFGYQVIGEEIIKKIVSDKK